MDKKRLVRLRITKVDLCRDGANPDADILIFKSMDPEPPAPTPPTLSKEHSVPKMTVKKVDKIDLAKATPEEITAYAKQLEASVDAHEEEFAKAFPPPKKKAKPGVPDDDDDDNLPVKKDDDVAMAKALVDVQKIVTEQAEEIKKTNKKNDELAEELRKTRDASELVTIEKTVERDMPSVPGTVTEVAKMLQEAKATLTAGSFTVLEKALKAGSAALTKATQEIGSGHGRSIGTAEEELFKAADDLVTQKVCKTRPEAVAEISKSRPDLAEAYRLEREAKNRR